MSNCDVVKGNDVMILYKRILALKTKNQFITEEVGTDLIKTGNCVFLELLFLNGIRVPALKESLSTDEIVLFGKYLEKNITNTQHLMVPPFEGYVYKQGNINTEYQRRYFVFDNNGISYYKNASDSKPCGKIPFSEIEEFKECGIGNHPFSAELSCYLFDIHTELRVFHCFVDQKVSMEYWQRAFSWFKENLTWSKRYSMFSKSQKMVVEYYLNLNSDSQGLLGLVVIEDDHLILYKQSDNSFVLSIKLGLIKVKKENSKVEIWLDDEFAFHMYFKLSDELNKFIKGISNPVSHQGLVAVIHVQRPGKVDFIAYKTSLTFNLTAGELCNSVLNDIGFTGNNITSRYRAIISKSPYSFVLSSSDQIIPYLESNEIPLSQDTISLQFFPSIEAVHRPTMSNIYSGWIHKQGHSVKSWKRRYFVLEHNNTLTYFKNPESRDSLGVLKVLQVKMVHHVEKMPTSFVMSVQVITPQREVQWRYFAADSEDDRRRWVLSFTR
ncbi:hypothetical protein ROZALSC1DRAFT_23581 [Rozella allomycis CSF55]|uniref:PH domain-containing protein n=1 Tax=Rozella allomycis (strain CSF55) TaxID=988480 RepID=A0A4P9YF39_ROZAC|nr:hypothetical protein ROZALSC1DRAFT_23581 [Rozella allomycis CSF55]